MTGRNETAFAKLNLALHVREKRDDGYHRIETIFAFCEDGDAVSAEPAEDLSLSLWGHFADAISNTDNIAISAVRALREASGTSPGASIRLQKVLPVGGGLGGGSADAAAVLRLLNEMWGLGWPLERLEEVARGLGADVPACLHSTPMRGEGRGDELQPADVELSCTPVLLVNPRETLPTGDVFARWDGVDRGPLDEWRHGRNDLEDAAASMAPQIGSVLAWLSVQQGAHCVRMSGSGPTCFALFETDAQRDHSAHGVPREWWRLATRLR